MPRLKKSPVWDSGLLRFGVELITTGYNGESVQAILGNVIKSIYERNMVGAQVLRSMAIASPAFGMMGTLIGLIAMPSC